MQEKDKVIKTKLQEARLNEGLSQEALADLIGMTQSSYCRRENGKKTITPREWARIAKALCVEEETIYETNCKETDINNVINIEPYYMSSLVAEYITSLRNENKVLREKLRNFEIQSKKK